MARLVPAVLLAPLLAAASAPVQPQAQPLDQTLKQAKAEQAAAEARAAGFLRVANSASGEAARLQAQQLAAMQALEASEAQITAADAELRLASARLAAQRGELQREQQPVASLLAGLALMAQRPPLLAIADQHSTDELVRVRILLDATLPVIRKRAAALSAQLGESARLEKQASAARDGLSRSRQLLLTRREQFAALEQRSLRLASSAARQSLTAGDAALASGEDIATLQNDASRSRSAWALASQVNAGDAAPPRPAPPESAVPHIPFSYRLPVAAPVTDGFGAVSDAGIRSRGVTFRAARGAAVVAPGAGIIRFSGPYRNHDGVVIIDHGGGWASLLVGVASTLQAGTTVTAGQPLGRALGPVEVELSRNGTRVSPALIAGSSTPLSNAAKSG